jgi:hypothetical protein
MIALFMLAVSTTGLLSDVLLGLAIIFALLASAKYIFKAAKYGPIAGPLLAAAAVISIIGTMIMARNAMQGALGGMGSAGSAGLGGLSGGSPKMPTERVYGMDSGGMFTGGRMYESGGPTTEHGMAILQKGETVIPKTRNMLDAGLTLNIGGDVVTDNAEDFAERIATVLPEALRRQSDIGGI